MTATITLNNPNTIWTTEYPSTNSITITNINSERLVMNNGTEVLSIPYESADKTMVFQVGGQKIAYNISAKYIGTTTNIRAFTKAMKFLSKNQVGSVKQGGSFTPTITYTNTDSKYQDLYAGLTGSIDNVVFDDKNSDSPSEIKLTFTITETSGV